MPAKVHGSGARDRWITIEALTESQGGSGFPVESWSLLTQIWAMKEDARAIERFVADQLSAPYDTRWEIPYRLDMDPELVEVPKKRRLIVHNRVHDIIAANEIGRKRGIELLTQAGGLLE